MKQLEQNDLLHHWTDLYQNMNRIMEQVRFHLLPSQ